MWLGVLIGVGTGLGLVDWYRDCAFYELLSLVETEDWISVQ